MSDNLNLPAGAAPPKPPEASKVQPKKETVRISLPPKAAAKETVRLELPPRPAAKETVRLELPPRPSAGGAAAPASPSGASVTSKPNLPQAGPTISLVVPQVDDASKTVKIPNPAEMVTLQHAPPKPALGGKPAMPAKPAAPAAKGAAPAAKAASIEEEVPDEAETMAAVAQMGAKSAPAAAATGTGVKASVQLPAAKGKEAPKAEKIAAASGAPGKASLVDNILATLSFITALGALAWLAKIILF